MFRNISFQKSGDDPGGWRLRASFSPDGVHWTAAGDSDYGRDRTTVFYNPFRQVWVASLRAGGPQKERTRDYFEDRDPLAVLRWRAPESRRRVVPWIGADTLDPAREDLALRHAADRPFDDTPSQLYNLDCVAYESVMLGLFSIWRGQQIKLPKINEVCVGYSRDGFHWWRPDRRPFCPVAANEPVWNSGNLQSAGGCCLVVGDKLYFYVGAVPGRSAFADPGNVGLAILRRDGFTSLDAGDRPGIVTTRPRGLPWELPLRERRLSARRASRGDPRFRWQKSSLRSLSRIVRPYARIEPFRPSPGAALPIFRRSAASP